MNCNNNISRARRNRKRQSAMVLIEISVGLGALLIIAILLMRHSINVATMDRWTVMQSLTDTYLTREVALAKRYPFSEFTGGSTLWPTFPSTAESSIEVGRLPGGEPVIATLYRTKKPSDNNMSTAGGSGTETTNPTNTEAWVLQSYLTHEVGQRNYLKSRSVVRSQ